MIHILSILVFVSTLYALRSAVVLGTALILCNFLKGSRSMAQLGLTKFYCRHCGLTFYSETLNPCPCCGMDEAEPQQEVA
jgi:ribosomal protein L37E